MTDAWLEDPYRLPDGSGEPRVVEPRLGIVGVANAWRAVGWGLLLAAVICLMSLLAIGAVGEFTGSGSLTLLSRGLALSSLIVGIGGGAMIAVAATVVSLASLRQLRAAMTEHPRDAINLAGLRFTEPTNVRVPWGLACGVMLLIIGSAWMYFADTAAGPILAVCTVLLLAATWLCFRGVLRSTVRWNQEWEKARGELARRRRLADAADERRRAAFVPGPGPSPRGAVLMRTLDRSSGRLFALACVLFPAGLLLATVLGSRFPAGTLVFAVVVLAPWIVGEVGLLGFAFGLVLAERRVIAWARGGPQRAGDDRGVRQALLGPRASWIGSLALASAAGLAGCAAIAARVPIDGQRVLEVPSWLPALGGWGVLLAIAWGMADLPLARTERTRIRAMCAPGDVQPEPRQKTLRSQARPER